MNTSFSKVNLNTDVIIAGSSSEQKLCQVHVRFCLSSLNTETNFQGKVPKTRAQQQIL